MFTKDKGKQAEEDAEKERAEKDRAEKDRAEKERAQRSVPAPQFSVPAPAQAIIRRYSCCFEVYSAYGRCKCGKNGLPVPHLGEAYFGKSRCYDPNCETHRGGQNRVYLPHH